VKAAKSPRDDEAIVPLQGRSARHRAAFCRLDALGVRRQHS
jgi:hypothetical protein